MCDNGDAACTFLAVYKERAPQEFSTSHRHAMTKPWIPSFYHRELARARAAHRSIVVKGSLDLSNNNLTLLPKSLGAVPVGGDLFLDNNKLDLEAMTWNVLAWRFNKEETDWKIRKQNILATVQRFIDASELAVVFLQEVEPDLAELLETELARDTVVAHFVPHGEGVWPVAEWEQKVPASFTEYSQGLQVTLPNCGTMVIFKDTNKHLMKDKESVTTEDLILHPDSGLKAACIKVNGNRFVSAHLHRPDKELVFHNEECSGLEAMLLQTDIPTVLGADTNSERFAHAQSVASYPSECPTARIDVICCSSSITCKPASIVEQGCKYSDHCPIKRTIILLRLSSGCLACVDLFDGFDYLDNAGWKGSLRKRA